MQRSFSRFDVFIFETNGAYYDAATLKYKKAILYMNKLIYYCKMLNFESWTLKFGEIWRKGVFKTRL